MSYCEIYNEALYDLLHWTREQLQVRWDAGRGFHVPNLAVRDCPSVDDMLHVGIPQAFNHYEGPMREDIHLSSKGLFPACELTLMQQYCLRPVCITELCRRKSEL